MKKLNFQYEVHYSFSSPVTDHCYALRILPQTNKEQGIYASEYQISGGGSCSGKMLLRDGLGNLTITGRIAEAHDTFSFSVKGTAFVDRSARKKREEHCHPMYRYPTDLTAVGESLEAFYLANRETVSASAKAESAEDTAELARACRWMERVHESFVYQTGRTGIHTTAEEAWQAGCGVCQDYAQILIALLRKDGIPARYIAGMVLGEGATHAWCEAWCDGSWVGLDPTHGQILNDDYIEISRGRDYRDAIMDRGNFRGFALQEQRVEVRVTEAQGTGTKRSDSRLGVL